MRGKQVYARLCEKRNEKSALRLKAADGVTNSLVGESPLNLLAAVGKGAKDLEEGLL